MSPEGELSESLMDTSTHRAADAISQFGCFVARRAVDPSLLAPMLAAAKERYAVLDEAYARGELDPDVMRRSYGYGILRIFEDQLALPDGSYLHSRVLDAFEASCLPGLIASYLGRDVELLLEACHVRRQAPKQPGRPVPAHQDSSVMGVEGDKLLTLWVPLVDGAGSMVPGIDLIPRSIPEVLGCGIDDPPNTEQQRMYSRFEIGSEVLHKVLSAQSWWTPTLDRGDVLLLNGQVVHRTAFTHTMQQPRYNFELRFAASSSIGSKVPGSRRSFRIGETCT